VPQIGAISMDQLMLDVSAIPDLKGRLLLGQEEGQISADDWAAELNTISWEILWLQTVCPVGGESVNRAGNVHALRQDIGSNEC